MQFFAIIFEIIDFKIEKIAFKWKLTPKTDELLPNAIKTFPTVGKIANLRNYTGIYTDS